MGEVMEHRDCMRPIHDPKDPDEQYANARGFVPRDPGLDGEPCWRSGVLSITRMTNREGVHLFDVFDVGECLGTKRTLRGAVHLAMSAPLKRGPEPSENPRDYAVRMGWQKVDQGAVWTKDGREIRFGVGWEGWDVDGRAHLTLSEAIDWCEQNPVDPPKPAVNFDCTPIELDPEPPMVQGRVDEPVVDQNARKKGKVHMEYVPLGFVAGVAEVMEDGLQEPGRYPGSWLELSAEEHGLYVGAALRHLRAIQERGIGALDEKSGKLHAYHLGACAVVMAGLAEKHGLGDGGEL